MKANNENPFEGLENLNNIEFEPTIQVMSDLQHKQSKGIKVQSVVYPTNYNPHRDEQSVIDWLYNNIQSLHTANFVLRIKYNN
jgi:hypothetical protein